MDALARLFGSAIRTKFLRLFLFNTAEAFTVAQIVSRTKATKDATRKELAILTKAGVLKKGKGKEIRYGANTAFKHFEALESFLRATDGVSASRLLETIKKSGQPKLIVLSGFFTGQVEPKIDILVVADSLSERSLERGVHELEAELGREIRYAAFLTPDFRYRQGVYDRLIRDVLDYPHRILIDKIGL